MLQYLGRYQRSRSLSERARKLPVRRGEPVVALIHATGPIRRGRSGRGPLSGGAMGSDTIAGAIRAANADASARAIVLRVNSPGGSYVASDTIWRKVVRARASGKPVVVSMGDVAASGGYFIAMTGDPLVAYRATETGSIGVFFGKPNLRGLYDKIGMKTEMMTRGRFADIDTVTAPLNDAQRAKLRTEIEVFYKSFVDKVAGARKRGYNDVEPLAQGRVWTGAQAKQNGLVDEIGGIDRAIEMVKQRAKIGAAEKIVLVPYPPRRSLFQVLMDRDQLAELESYIFESRLDTRIESKLSGLTHDPAVRSLIHSLVRGALTTGGTQGGILSRMPYSV
ncbi:MAG TPA: signal peptide peptidase SppA, partial [Actinobacteria bacterium]|nr:signal peptide peptidase SppA [Actinomycetota bacterium]